MKFYLSIIFGLLFIYQAAAWDASPSCVEQIERGFYDPVLVSEALGLQEVSESSWDLINQALQARAADIPRQVKAARDQMSQDPFQYPFDGPASWGLIRQILYANLAEVLDGFMVRNPTNVAFIFQYLEDKQKLRIRSCFNLKD